VPLGEGQLHISEEPTDALIEDFSDEECPVTTDEAPAPWQK